MIFQLPSASHLLPNVYTFGQKVGQTLVKYYFFLLLNTKNISLLRSSAGGGGGGGGADSTCTGDESSSNDGSVCMNMNTTATTGSTTISDYLHQQQDGSGGSMNLSNAQLLPKQIYTMIITFPVWYSEWWWNLVQNDPIHVFVETILLLSIFYFLVSRRGMKSYKDKHQNSADRLTKQEEDELILQWIQNERHPLTPFTTNANGTTGGTSSSSNNNTTTNNNNNNNANLQQQQNEYRPTMVVHKSNGRFMDVEEILHPGAVVPALPDHGTPTIANKTVTTATTTNAPEPTNSSIVGSSEGSNIIRVLNFATMDFLGMSANTIPPSIHDDDNEDDDEDDVIEVVEQSLTSSSSSSKRLHPVKVASLEALDRYGCGSCGPRGFYGTIDVHLHIEKNIATFLCTEDALLYSDGASTVTSTIAAFCKRGDIIIVDEACYEPIRTGVQLSRATVKWFAHNNMKDLRRVLSSIQQSDKKRGRKSNAQRRYIVVEGLFKNTGTICPLDELIALKHEFNCRLILDESYSFGTLGPNGRGATELYQQQLMHDVEITCVSLENAMGSIGGLTTGTEEVVDHQRLSGSGYVYSASSPPFTASAALAALNLLQNRPDVTLQRLNRNRLYFHEQLQQLLHDKLEDLLIVTSDLRSPLIMLQVADIPETEYLDEVVFLQEVVRESFFRGVAFVATATGTSAAAIAASNVTPETSTATQLAPPVPDGFISDPPSGIRMTVSAVHKLTDIDRAIQVLGEAVDVVMSRFHDEETTM